MMEEVLRKEVLKNIAPSKKEDKVRWGVVNSIIQKLKSKSVELDYDCEFFVGGSFGKGTYLRGSSDVDVFARFSMEYDDVKLSNMLEKILDSLGIDFIRQKGSRDYFSHSFKSKLLDFNFEFVPVKRIKTAEQAVNSTDVSAFHVEFLKSIINKNKKIIDEIRLAKQFFKSKKLYGAESYIRGFSGHVIDILVAYYGSLDKLLDSAKSWGEEELIDISNFYDGIESAKKDLEEDKHSRLIVVDPIIKQRNAAKALSEDNYFKFLLIAKNFDKLRHSDFVVERFDLIKLIKGAKKFAKMGKLDMFFYILEFDVGSRSEDIVGSKLLKLNKKLEGVFKSYDFDVFKNEFFIDMKKGVCLQIFFFEKIELSKLKKVKGPYVYMHDAVLKFIENKNFYFIEDSRIWSYEERAYTKPEEIARINKNDCFELLNKEVDFIKKMKVFRY